MHSVYPETKRKQRECSLRDSAEKNLIGWPSYLYFHPNSHHLSSAYPPEPYPVMLTQLCFSLTCRKLVSNVRLTRPAQLYPGPPGTAGGDNIFTADTSGVN